MIDDREEREGQFSIEIVGRGSDYIKKCEPLMKEALTTNDGSGILSESALYEADNVLIVSDRFEKAIVAYCAISDMSENWERIQANNVLEYFSLEKEGTYIEQLVVAKAYRRQGHAKELIKCLQWEEEIKKPLYSHVSIKNRESTKLHIDCDFKPINWYHSNLFHGIVNYNSIFYKG